MTRCLPLLLVPTFLLPAPGWCGEKDKGPPQPALKTAVLKRGPVELTVRAVGTIEPEDVVDIGAQVNGAILKFGTDPREPTKAIDFGSAVEAGTLLAQIDPALYQAKVQQARANLERAQAEIKLAEAKQRLAERNWQRAQALYRQKAMSQEDHDSVRGTYEVAEANVAVSKAAHGQAEAALREAEVNLGYTTIRSPIKGVVVDRRVNLGQTVLSNLNAPSLFLVARDLAKMHVWAHVAEADIGHIKVGQAVRFTVDARPKRTFEGKVLRQGTQAARLNATPAPNAVIYTVVVGFDNADGLLLPYMTAELRFLAGKKQALLVPNAALHWGPQSQRPAPEVRKPAPGLYPGPAPLDGKAAVVPQEGRWPARGVVWVQEKGRLRPVALRLGLSDGHVTEVLDGLSEGQTVVVGE
jgi:HlyD family secretion protein